MITRIAICLLIPVFLTAQDSNWQQHLFANYLLGIAETSETKWFATPNSILQFDKNKETGQLLHFNNTPVARQILDIYQEGPETILILSGHNEISRWHDGQWSHQVLHPSGNTSLRRIIGQTEDGTYYIGDYTTIFRWGIDDEITPVPEINAAGFSAVFDDNGWMWLWRYNRLVAFNEHFELMIDQTPANNYINDLIIDEVNDNVWVVNSSTVDIWLTAEQRWESFPNAGFYFNSGSKLLSAENNETVIGSDNQLYKLSYSAESGLAVESLLDPIQDFYLPLHGAFFDKEDRFWFFNNYENQLMYWKKDEGFQALEDSYWLPVSDIFSLGLDQQGKMWIAGWGQPAYFMGGRWHLLPRTANQAFPLQGGARDIVFTAEGNPVVGTGTLFTFGFPDSELMAWDGINWDTLEGADFGSQFLLIREIELDKNNNLWVMRADDEFFSVKSQGEWYRYKMDDMPIDANRFTCLEAGHNGQMWIGTDKGVVSYDGFRYVGYDSTAISLGNGGVRDIMVDDEGNVWLSLHTAGVRKWDGQEWTVALDEVDLPINTGANLLAADGKGGLWASVDGEGLIHFDGQEWEWFNTQNSGLANDYLSNIIVDEQSRLWCSSYQSISVYTPDKMHVPPFELAAVQELAVFPNPGCCQFMVHWEAALAGNYKFYLFNKLGQEVRHWSSDISVAGEQVFTFREDDLSPGGYVLQMVYEDEAIANQQLIISY